MHKESMHPPSDSLDKKIQEKQIKLNQLFQERADRIEKERKEKRRIEKEEEEDRKQEERRKRRRI